MPFTVVFLVSGRCPTWERALLACPGVVAGCRLSSAGVTHDIVLNDVKKCTYLGSLTLATTLLERRKNAFTVAQGSSRAARFRVAPRRVACWLRAGSRVHVGQMWGTPATAWPFAVGGRQSVVAFCLAHQKVHMWGNVGVLPNPVCSSD